MNCTPSPAMYPCGISRQSEFLECSHHFRSDLEVDSMFSSNCRECHNFDNFGHLQRPRPPRSSSHWSGVWRNWRRSAKDGYAPSQFLQVKRLDLTYDSQPSILRSKCVMFDQEVPSSSPSNAEEDLLETFKNKFIIANWT